MLRHCIAMLAGAYALGLCPSLPGERLAALVAITGLMCLRWRRSRLVAAFAAGFVLTWHTSLQLLEDRLAPDARGQTMSISAQITEFSVVNNQTARFVVAIAGDRHLPSRVRLSWLDAERIPQIGETWDLQVRLRPPRGFSNPYGFDYEGWLFRNNIGATGYVLSGSVASAEPVTASAQLARLRARLAQRISELLPADDASAVLLAITVGARHNISNAAWLSYARTGTSHLMAISGLHFGLAAGAAVIVCWCLASLFARRANLRDLSLFVAVPAAYAYALLAGMAIPAQRAAVMATLAVSAVLVRRPMSASRQLSLACLAAVALNPAFVFAPGFKLSFAAVAILFWYATQLRVTLASWRERPFSSVVTRISALWKMQIALLFGLFAMTALLFGRSALLAPAVNMIVLPVFSLITVPFSLAGLMLDGVLHPAGDFLLLVAYDSIRLTLAIVVCAAELPLAGNALTAVQGPIAFVALLVTARVVVPPGWPGRHLAWIAALAVLLYRPAPPPSGCMDLHVLDVGQGLTTLLRTTNHSIVFDTGPAFRSGSDTATLVTIPFLRALGIQRIDLLVISHGDLDHAGGVASLLGELSVTRAIAGEPRLLDDIDAEQCVAGQSWQFDGLGLSVIHPHAGAAWSGNDASCVLMASLGRHRVLLTGDIESPVENLLAADLLPVSVALIPHHGSNTSSSRNFVAALRPDIAIVSAGYANRWGFPRPAVTARWRSIGSQILNTAEDGAITQRLCSNKPAAPVQRQRADNKRLWHLAGET